MYILDIFVYTAAALCIVSGLGREKEAKKRGRRQGRERANSTVSMRRLLEHMFACLHVQWACCAALRLDSEKNLVVFWICYILDLLHFGSVAWTGHESHLD